MSTPSPIDAIKSNAALVISVAREQLGEELGFDERAVRWLDGYIQRQHESGDPSLRDRLASTLGSFLGQCITQTYGGKWAESEGSWAVCFDDKNCVFPIAKVSKQLQNGAEDSVLSFFTVIPIVFSQSLKEK